MPSTEEIQKDQVKAVLDLKETLEKFKDKKRMVISTLEELKELPYIDYNILKETGIGKIVNGFRKDSEIGGIARDLVSKWKSLTAETIQVSKYHVTSSSKSEKKGTVDSDTKSTTRTASVRIKKEKTESESVKDVLTHRTHETSNDRQEALNVDTNHQRQQNLLKGSKSAGHRQGQNLSNVSYDCSRDEEDSNHSMNNVKTEAKRIKVETDKIHQTPHMREHHRKESTAAHMLDTDFEAALNGVVRVKQEKVISSNKSKDDTSEHRQEALPTDDRITCKKSKTSETQEKASTSEARSHKSEHKYKSSSKKHKKDRSSHKHKSKDRSDKDSRKTSDSTVDERLSSGCDKSLKRKAEEPSHCLSFEEMISTAKYPNVVKKKKEETLEDKIAKSVKQNPLPDSYLDDLPELLTDYKPLPKTANASTTSRHDPNGANQVFEFKDIKASSRSEAVFSGRRRCATSMQSLKQLCLNVLSNHIDDLEFVGGVPYSILEPVLRKATPTQLFNIEHYNATYTEETDSLWKEHCKRDFKGQKPQEFESWRELYLRKFDEREQKFQMLHNRLAAKEQQKQTQARKSKVAYAMSSQPKPPREVRRKQAKYGTGSGSVESTAKAAAMIKNEDLCRSLSGASGSSSAKMAKVISVPPLMKKTKKFMSKLHHR